MNFFFHIQSRLRAHLRLGLTLIICVYATVSAYALQPPVFEFVNEVKAQTHNFAVDRLSNLYWLEDGSLIKYNPKKDEKLQYSNRNWGDIHAFDVSNPLNIIVLFKDFNRIVFLDKNLNPKDFFVNESSLINIRPTLICSSEQNGFWAFSPLDYKIYRFNDKFNIEIESESINHMFPDFSNPFQMIESSDRLFISDKESGIWVFDRFANFSFVIPLKNIGFFQVRDNTILYFKDNLIGMYNFEQHSEELFLLPEENVLKGYIMDMYLYLLKADAIKQYRIK